jgi:RNA-directed DNA polymerase
MAVGGWEVGKSEGCPVMGRIGVETSLHAKAGRRPTGLSLQKNLENRKNEEKQMTAIQLVLTGASSASYQNWLTINWERVIKEVQRLQMRIAKAVREKRYGKVRALQWLL